MASLWKPSILCFHSKCKNMPHHFLRNMQKACKDRHWASLAFIFYPNAFFGTFQFFLFFLLKILEYTVPVWCPYLSAPWRVYREACRLALHHHKGEMPYVDHCKLLKWPSLLIESATSSSVDTIIWIFMISSNSQKLGQTVC